MGDVANWIEHKNPSKMLNGVELDNTELVKNFIEITYSYGNSSRTRKQESLFLTEDGLYVNRLKRIYDLNTYDVFKER